MRPMSVTCPVQIRAKERAQAEAAMRGQTPEQQLRSLQLSRLPKLVDAMHMYARSSSHPAVF